ncbi:MAG TPA: cohesin domain-containing protein [Casimicrobiaceae bacterium]|jgi:hypothetical protein|nr:cohesin domain-containing protein [Casimicrobiaceae bacterium]
MLIRRRRLIILGVVVTLFTLVSAWIDQPRWHYSAAPASSPDVAQRDSADASSLRDAVVAPSSGARMSSGGAVAPTAIAVPRNLNAAPVRLQLDVPTDVKVGDVFEARVDVEASREVGQLMFHVSYDKTRLSLVGWSAADFSQQWGFPAELAAQEPSDGNVEVMFTVSDGRLVAGAGNLALLQFEAIKAGASDITLQNATAIDRTGTADTNVAVVREGRVAIH